MTPGSSTRALVLACLQVFASREHQLKLQESIPEDVFPKRLCELWFDQIFTPSTTYVECLRGDYNPEATEGFWKNFSEEEQFALERFHRFFELRVEMLPNRNKESWGAIANSDFWVHMIKEARLALDYFDDAELSKLLKNNNLIKELL